MIQTLPHYPCVLGKAMYTRYSVHMTRFDVNHVTGEVCWLLELFAAKPFCCCTYGCMYYQLTVS